MYNLLLTILLVLSVVIVIAIFMQPTKNQSSNVFDAVKEISVGSASHSQLYFLHV